MKMKRLMLCLLLLLCACQSRLAIVYNLSERDANEIVVLLASKGIEVEKVPAPTSNTGPGSGQQLWEILVASKQITEALAVLNQAGLPRVKGSNLLEIFGSQSLVPSDMQDKIRYQEGLSEQLAMTIRKMEGVLDADVQITLPRDEDDTSPLTASVYIKHRGIIDNPNSILVNKIKRLVSSAVPNMRVEDVSVVADRAIISSLPQNISENSLPTISIWGIALAPESVVRFRTIFYALLLLLALCVGIIAYLVWKLLPIIMKQPYAWWLSLQQIEEHQDASSKEDVK